VNGAGLDAEKRGGSQTGQHPAAGCK